MSLCARGAELAVVLEEVPVPPAFYVADVARADAVYAFFGFVNHCQLLLEHRLNDFLFTFAQGFFVSGEDVVALQDFADVLLFEVAVEFELGLNG